MYFPYFRGKQFELISIRESVNLLQDSDFTPIVEPIKHDLSSGLFKTLDEVVRAKGRAIVIVNPNLGTLTIDCEIIAATFLEKYSNSEEISLGVLLNENMSKQEIKSIIDLCEDKVSSLIHAGFSEARSLEEWFGDKLGEYRHVFTEERSGKLYQRHFRDYQRVLIRDGFQKRKNRDYPTEEFFSDLHVTYEDEGMEGFGDFLIVGNNYSPSGGAAYAVAIHLTYIDSNRDDQMHIYHFKSIRGDDPGDLAGKFAEAAEKLVEKVQLQDSQILKSSAVAEFLNLNERGHFPGLGYTKKLSMRHHIETLADYFKTKN